MYSRSMMDRCPQQLDIANYIWKAHFRWAPVCNKLEQLKHSWGYFCCTAVHQTQVHLQQRPYIFYKNTSLCSCQHADFSHNIHLAAAVEGLWGMFTLINVPTMRVYGFKSPVAWLKLLPALHYQANVTGFCKHCISFHNTHTTSLDMKW